jgi:hypothetical protein
MVHLYSKYLRWNARMIYICHTSRWDLDLKTAQEKVIKVLRVSELGGLYSSDWSLTAYQIRRVFFSCFVIEPCSVFTGRNSIQNH